MGPGQKGHGGLRDRSVVPNLAAGLLGGHVPLGGRDSSPTRALWLREAPEAPGRGKNGALATRRIPGREVELRISHVVLAKNRRYLDTGQEKDSRSNRFQPPGCPASLWIFLASLGVQRD